MKINASALINSIRSDLGGGAARGAAPAPAVRGAGNGPMPAPVNPQPASTIPIQAHPGVNPQAAPTINPQQGVSGLSLQGGNIPAAGGAIKLAPLAYHPAVGLHFKVMR